VQQNIFISGDNYINPFSTGRKLSSASWLKLLGVLFEEKLEDLIYISLHLFFKYLRYEQCIQNMHLSMSTCSGRVRNPQDFDTGDLPHPQDYDGAPLWWGSLTN
jgi:hypothetical protein